MPLTCMQLLWKKMFSQLTQQSKTKTHQRYNMQIPNTNQSTLKDRHKYLLLFKVCMKKGRQCLIVFHSMQKDDWFLFFVPQKTSCEGKNKHSTYIFLQQYLNNFLADADLVDDVPEDFLFINFLPGWKHIWKTIWIPAYGDGVSHKNYDFSLQFSWCSRATNDLTICSLQGENKVWEMSKIPFLGLLEGLSIAVGVALVLISVLITLDSSGGIAPELCMVSFISSSSYREVSETSQTVMYTETNSVMWWMPIYQAFWNKNLWTKRLANCPFFSLSKMQTVASTFPRG